MHLCKLWWQRRSIDAIAPIDQESRTDPYNVELAFPVCVTYIVFCKTTLKNTWSPTSMSLFEVFTATQTVTAAPRAWRHVLPRCGWCTDQGRTSETGMKLQHLSITEWNWVNITMNFISDLLRSKSGHDTVWVVVDRSTKSAHFLPIRLTDSLDKPTGCIL